MSHILKGLSKRNMHIPHIVLYDEDKWHKMCSNAYFGFFTGGGHFWRVTHPLDGSTVARRESADSCQLIPVGRLTR